jgi:hypothetical protein
VLNEVEEGDFGPVQVLEHHDQRALLCQSLEEPAHGPEDLLLARPAPLGEVEGGGEPVGDERGVLRAREQREHAFARQLAGRLLDDLPQRPEGDSLAVGEAAPHEHGGLCAAERCELAGEARLADSRRAEDGDEVRHPLADRPCEDAAELGELLRSAHERRLGALWDNPGSGHELEQAPAGGRRFDAG